MHSNKGLSDQVTCGVEELLIGCMVLMCYFPLALSVRICISLLECMGIELCIYLKRRSILVHLCHNLCLFNFENAQLHEPRVRRLDAASLD